ncbi:MAG TPA: DoxX family protein [Planctomycetota bacterium]|nr:DoxX family protein [Planctomycetota bacterium]
MQIAALHRPAVRFLDRAAEPLRRAAPVVIRATLGHGFLTTGLGKLRNFDATVAFFASLGIPAPAANAGFVGALELVGGAALIVGFAVRPFAALLATTLVVALATHDGRALAESGAPLTVGAFVFLLLSALVFAYGAGPLSVDARLAQRAAA